MANTFTSLHYHIVFSTKNRELWIKPNFEERIWAYVGGIVKPEFSALRLCHSKISRGIREFRRRRPRCARCPDARMVYRFKTVG
jgi:hypothetical protein